MTSAVAVAELLLLSVSGESVLTCTVLLMVVPTAAGSGRSVMLAVCWLPLPSWAQVHSTVPLVASTAGVVQVPPPLGVALTKAMLAGMVSLIWTLPAAEGPLLTAVMT